MQKRRVIESQVSRSVQPSCCLSHPGSRSDVEYDSREAGDDRLTILGNYKSKMTRCCDTTRLISNRNPPKSRAMCQFEYYYFGYRLQQ